MQAFNIPLKPSNKMYKLLSGSDFSCLFTTKQPRVSQSTTNLIKKNRYMYSKRFGLNTDSSNDSPLG